MSTLNYIMECRRRLQTDRRKMQPYQLRKPVPQQINQTLFISRYQSVRMRIKYCFHHLVDIWFWGPYLGGRGGGKLRQRDANISCEMNFFPPISKFPVVTVQGKGPFCFCHRITIFFSLVTRKSLDRKLFSLSAKPGFETLNVSTHTNSI